MPTFRSLRREKIQLTISRTKQTENVLMKGLQPQNVRLEAGSQTDVEEVNAFKALKNPAHRRTVGRLVDLIGNRLRHLGKLAAQQVFR